jgi:hypothetical protein
MQPDLGAVPSKSLFHRAHRDAHSKTGLEQRLRLNSGVEDAIAECQLLVTRSLTTFVAATSDYKDR